MKVTKVCCQGCGADLRIDESIRYVTCNYCGAKLEIVHDETVTHTKRLDQIERTTGEIAKKVRVMELRDSIEHVDRAWLKFRQSALVADQSGNIHEPSNILAVSAGVLGTILGAVLSVMAFTLSSPLLVLPGILIIGFSCLSMNRGRAKAGAYRIERYRYESARKSLLQRLDSEQQS